MFTFRLLYTFFFSVDLCRRSHASYSSNDCDWLFAVFLQPLGAPKSAHKQNKNINKIKWNWFPIFLTKWEIKWKLSGNCCPAWKLLITERWMTLPPPWLSVFLLFSVRPVSRFNQGGGLCLRRKENWMRKATKDKSSQKWVMKSDSLWTYMQLASVNPNSSDLPPVT